MPSNAKLARPIGPTHTHTGAEPTPPHCRASRLTRTGAAPRRQRGGRVINRARPCVVWVAISRAAGHRRDFDCCDRYRSPSGGGVGMGRRHASRSAVGAPASSRAAAQRTRVVRRRSRAAAPRQAHGSGPRAGPARSVGGGPGRHGGALTGALSMSRWRSRELTRGVLIRARAPNRGTDAGVLKRERAPNHTAARPTIGGGHTTTRAGPAPSPTRRPGGHDG